MILRRHWALAAVAAIGLHAVGFSVLAQKPDIGAKLPDQQGIEIELGMLGELAGTLQSTDGDNESQTNVAPLAETAPELITEPEPEPIPEPEPSPRPEPLQKPEVQIKPEPKPESRSVPKPELEFKPVSKSDPKPIAKGALNVASNKPVDVDASPARAGNVPSDASHPGGAGSAGESLAAAAATGARTSWYAQVASHLARHKHYPMRARRMRHEAVVTLSFVVARDGSVRQAEITGPSKHRALNKAVEDMLERAKPLPVFPADLPGAEIRLSIPVAFKLR